MWFYSIRLPTPVETHTKKNSKNPQICHSNAGIAWYHIIVVDAYCKKKKLTIKQTDNVKIFLTHSKLIWVGAPCTASHNWLHKIILRIQTQLLNAHLRLWFFFSSVGYSPLMTAATVIFWLSLFVFNGASGVCSTANTIGELITSKDTIQTVELDRRQCSHDTIPERGSRWIE